MAAYRKITMRIPMFRMKATMTPKKRPGSAKYILFIVIIPIRYSFLNPRALSMPYSYVFESTSDSMSEYSSMVERIAKKTITVKRVAFKKA